jgi:hypothetical protein
MRTGFPLAAVFALGAVVASAQNPGGVFQRSTALLVGGDLAGGIRLLRNEAARGNESPALYWNWSQAAAARGTVGEAMWALLRARELDPGDTALVRELDRLRTQLSLDPAEVASEPLAALARTARRYHLGALAVILLAASLVAHGALRLGLVSRLRTPVIYALVALALALAIPSLAGAFAHPAGAVVQRGAALLDGASPTANPIGTLREGEVLPVLETSGGFLRVVDSSGARGWVAAGGVWRLDRRPSPASD